jgi:hypothetical protein
MTGWKLFRLRKDGTLGPLFINARQRVPVGVWLKAESHPTKGFALRPGWHVCSERNAPHLSKRGRVWTRVTIKEYEAHQRPAIQGGLWYVAYWMRVDKIY